jgi:hypothetical protein
MPGTPASTPRHAIPRIASTDTDDVPRDINAAVDRIDVTAPVFGSGLLSGRPSAGAGIADRYYYATDAARPDGSTGVLYRDAGGASPTWSAVTPVAPTATVTSLPGSPVDGQVIDYLADATNGVVWRLRYRTASASTYKWEYVGGAGLYATVATVIGTPAGVAATPAIAVPLAGEYEAWHGMGPGNNSTAGVWIVQCGLTVDGTTDLADSLITTTGPSSGSTQFLGWPVARQTRVTLAAAASLRQRFVSPSGVGSAGNRWIAIKPWRVG